ncbi:magnesium chelatase domain-containing protein [Streptomyces niveus]|uniref:magnesium chelatase domain-containing protein n=1 Tax=Streptomyces niveus TaxID=193462 RepID=UPI0036E9FB0C
MSNDITGLHTEKPRIPLAANHAALAVQTDPMTATLSHATEDAYFNAKRARTVLLRNATEYVARLVRQALPEAAVITVDTEEKELHAVLDRDGKTIWYAPATPASDLHDGLVDDINDLLADAIPFGGLVGAGWKVADQGEPFRTVPLPTGNFAARRTAATSFPTPEGMATVTAEFTPGGTPAFQITGPNSQFSREARDRIRAAIVNSDLEWKPGTLRIVAHWTVVRTGSSSDLTLACTALAAAGAIDPAALNGVALIGELGLDGRVRPVRDVTDAVRTAQAAGCRKFIVAADDFEEVSRNEAITPVGVSDLAAALSFLEEMHEPTTPTEPAARPKGTPGQDAGPCAQCDRQLIWDGTGKSVNDEYGEYLCYAPRRSGKAVHVLAK